MNKIIKGTQRRMIIVKTADSDLFDEAYFMIKRDAARESGALCETCSDDMISEANRIIRKSIFSAEVDTKGRKNSTLRSLAFYVGGLVSGGGIVGLFWIVAGM